MIASHSSAYALAAHPRNVPDDVLRLVKKNGGVVFWMTHPKLTYGEVLPHARAAAAIGLKEGDVVESVPAQVASTGNPHLYVALRDAHAVDAAVSDHARLQTVLGADSAFGIFQFAVNGENRLYSRMFSLDIPEDPATGSASGPLGAFAVRYGLVERAPKVEIVSEQGTKMGRQSFVHIEIGYDDDDADIPSRIEVGGSVMPVLKGELL